MGRHSICVVRRWLRRLLRNRLETIRTPSGTAAPGRRVVSIAGVSQPRALPRPGPGLRSGLWALLLLGLLVGPLLAGVPARGEDAAPVAETPLVVDLVRLSPATIPERGKVVLIGRVTNSSEATWSSVNVHPFISPTPITSRDDLAAAAELDPDAEVGTRLVEQNQFQSIGTLAPGASQPFRIALKVKDLKEIISGEAGVYWIGVHALGENADGGERETLGRARTFIPLVRGSEQTSVAVVVPVRDRVRRDPDGRLLSTSTWSEDLAPDGRLGRLGEFISSAGTHPATLLVDPAVLEAVRDLKDDNPAISLGPPSDETPEPTASPTDDPSRSDGRLDPADRANASAWLDRITAAAKIQTTLGLGYADPDATSLARRRPPMLALAFKLAAQTFADFDISAIPTVAPADGWFDEDLLSSVPGDSTVLVSDHAAPRTRTRWRTTAGQDLVFSDQQAGSGGPSPTAPTNALALRQRIISDAALRLGESRSSTPLVVQLPDDWDPGAGWQLAEFFDSLDQPWLNLVPLTPDTDPSTPIFSASLGYPGSARRAEIPAVNVGAGRTLIQTTTVLAKLLRSKNTIAHDLAAIAFEAVSYNARGEELNARQQVLSVDLNMRATLAKVQVIGTDFVTLSGGSGTLAVTLVNGLDQPVVVGVKPQSSSKDVRIDSTEAVRMAPGERTVLRLHAESSGVGVTKVVLSPVTADGTRLGTPLTFRLRTSPVGKLIWAVLGAGGLLLVVMIARRIRKGLRDHRWRRA